MAWPYNLIYHFHASSRFYAENLNAISPILWFLWISVGEMWKSQIVNAPFKQCRTKYLAAGYRSVFLPG